MVDWQIAEEIGRNRVSVAARRKGVLHLAANGRNKP
jgi:hypothetical protein